MKELIDLIKESKKILITTHSNPDVDAIGSSIGLYWILRSLVQKNVLIDLFLEDKQPFAIDFLEGLDKFQQTENITEHIANYDLVFILDLSASERLTQYELVKPVKTKFVLIDHHESETNIEADLKFVQPTASSTSEIVFKLFSKEVDISSQSAKALLAGIYDDTNSFSINNTGKATFEIAAELIEKGAKIAPIAEYVNTYDDKVLNGVKAIVTNLQFDTKRKYAYSYISRDLFEILELDGLRMDKIMNLTLNILLGKEGFHWGFLVRPKGEDQVKISFRARTNTQNVRILAEALGGGGHNEAAGLTLGVQDPYEALAIVRNKIDEVLK